MRSLELKFIPKAMSYWFKQPGLSTLLYKEILDRRFKFTYIINYELISNYELFNTKIENISPCMLLASNCRTNLLFDTEDLLGENKFDFLMKKPLSILQTNCVLPEYINFSEKPLELCLNLLSKNKLDWGIYSELSLYTRDVEIYCKDEVIAEETILRLVNVPN